MPPVWIEDDPVIAPVLRLRLIRAAVCLGMVGCHAVAVLAAGTAPDFAREVRPVLSNRCFKCHGPDEGNREAGLRRRGCFAGFCMNGVV